MGFYGIYPPVSSNMADMAGWKTEHSSMIFPWKPQFSSGIFQCHVWFPEGRRRSRPLPGHHNWTTEIAPFEAHPARVQVCRPQQLCSSEGRCIAGYDIIRCPAGYGENSGVLLVNSKLSNIYWKRTTYVCFPRGRSHDVQVSLGIRDCWDGRHSSGSTLSSLSPPSKLWLFLDRIVH